MTTSLGATSRSTPSRSSRARGALADPFGGLADLGHRLLRATTGGSFAGDPLRVLRLSRLLVRLPGFATVPETVDLARRAAPRLPEMAAECIRDELWLLLSPAGAERGSARSPSVPVPTGGAMSGIWPRGRTGGEPEA